LDVLNETLFTMLRGQDTSWQIDIVAFASYALLATMAGFGVALDIFRRLEQTHPAADRVRILLGVALWFTFSFLIGGVVTYLTWRRALALIAMEKWRRLKSVSS